ncbi:MAG: hypothetical protein JST14_10555 [Bacteroidetes bacterium]|nr:hypothetical protein [Bacteroidota bacterium]
MNLLRRNREFWTHERSLSALLIYLSLMLLLWMPASGHTWLEFIFKDLLFILITVAGVYSVLTNWKRQLFFIGLATLAAALRVVNFLTPSVNLNAVNDALTILFFVFLSYFVLHHIFKDGPVNFYRIQGSLVVFMIMGFFWAFLYHLLEDVNPGSFATMKGPVTLDYGQYVYFSFVTMTTLGYGDITAVHPIARSLVVFEGMIGLLYPTVMVARLVAMELEHSRSTWVHKEHGKENKNEG